MTPFAADMTTIVCFPFREPTRKMRHLSVIPPRIMKTSCVPSRVLLLELDFVTVTLDDLSRFCTRLWNFGNGFLMAYQRAV